MRYADAFKIGSKVEGYIKCTYAEIHSPEFGLLFSFNNTVWAKLSAAAKTGLNIGVGSMSDGDFAIHAGGQEVYIPVVNTDKFVGAEEKFVPVTLTKLAYQYIKKQIEIAFSKSKAPNAKHLRAYKRVIEYQLCRVWDKAYATYKVGSYEIVLSWIDVDSKPDISNYTDTNLYHYEIRQESKIIPSPEMVQFLERGETAIFYVKQAAIDWYPTDIENAVIENEGVVVNLNIALEKAKQKYENAKAILAAAGAFAIM